ncbi:heavy metal translocating P-type ATPase [Treponema sp.]|jgi:Cd2+/Zn2+-exporting ATPase|uniref:heavy metal translocating P-type ATPase n=1 Tax=Treponema sp. TaxID=166 RepID=UPI00257AA3C5|nr:heavy metal translocating P-type ATPase [Treponema sp.]MBE6354799.1 cadmium-translocating P-type ATPase [Treponema sp.]
MKKTECGESEELKYEHSAHEHHHEHNHEHHHCCCHDDCCADDEGDDDDEEEEEEGSLKKIIIAALFFITAVLLEKLPFFSGQGMYVRGAFLACYFAAYMLTGFSVLKEAVLNIIHGEWFGEEFLMSVAAIGAVFMGEYSEGVAVMILFQFGEYLEDKAVDHSKHSISELVKIRSDSANIKKDGQIVNVPAEEVAAGDIIVVKPGERIPLDGKVVSGKTMVDTSALTGESVPREVMEGETVLAGFMNVNGVIEVSVEKEFSESSVSRILKMVRNAQSKKARTEKFIRKFAKIYTPLVCITAVAIAVIPPLVSGGSTLVWHTWIYRALELLVVSCPCALVISIPLSFFSGIGLASRNGILIKGSNYIEMLSRAGTVVFDKTGTLTKGVFEVTKINVASGAGITEEELVKIAAHAEYYSEHPISRSLKKIHSCPDCLKLNVKDAEEISGHGIKCKLDGKQILAGNRRLMEIEGVQGIEYAASEGGTVIYVAEDKKFLGSIIISDVLKEDAASAIAELYRNKVSQTVMLTGDTKEAAELCAEKTGITQVFSQLLPDGKLEVMEKLISEKKKNESVIFVGDGINDAPVLSRSDAGIAMGAMGSDSAIEAADVVIMNDSISAVSKAIKISRITMKNVRQNTFFSLAAKTAIIVLCAVGLGNMWLAVFGDVGVTMLAVLNSIRVLRKSV